MQAHEDQDQSIYSKVIAEYILQIQAKKFLYFNKMIADRLGIDANIVEHIIETKLKPALNQLKISDDDFINCISQEEIQKLINSIMDEIINPTYVPLSSLETKKIVEAIRVSKSKEVAAASLHVNFYQLEKYIDEIKPIFDECGIEYKRRLTTFPADRVDRVVELIDARKNQNKQQKKQNTANKKLSSRNKNNATSNNEIVNNQTNNVQEDLSLEEYDITDEQLQLLINNPNNLLPIDTTETQVEKFEEFVLDEAKLDELLREPNYIVPDNQTNIGDFSCHQTYVANAINLLPTVTKTTLSQDHKHPFWEKDSQFPEAQSVPMTPVKEDNRKRKLSSSLFDDGSTNDEELIEQQQKPTKLWRPWE